MTASQSIRPVRHEEAQTRGPRDAGEERGQAAGAGVGMVEILECEEDGLSLAAPLQQAVNRLVDPRRTTLGRDIGPPAAAHRVAKTRPELREQACQGSAPGPTIRRSSASSSDASQGRSPATIGA